MTQNSQTDSSPDPQWELPGSVHLLTLGEKQVYLVGTAHISARSVEDVREVIEKVRPDSVCVELDEARRKALAEGSNWREMDVVKVIRRGQATLLLAHLILSAFQRRLGEQLGVKPGAEMLQAIRSAQQTGSRLVLADREIRITLRRTWAALTWLDKMKLTFQLLMTLVLTPEIDAEEIEQLKEHDMLSQVMETFARAFPRAKVTLINERDAYLAEYVRNAPGEKIVAVVGAGHVEGMLKILENPEHERIDLKELTSTPSSGILVYVFKWGIPLLVLGVLGYGFATADAAVSLEMIKVWVLANGLLAALGTLIALAHPLTIFTAFIAAPLTSLNPMIAAGWVAGLVEAVLRKPRVRDFESLPGDLTSLKGVWRNGITRILLVVALANLGSTVGTFVGLPLITRLLGG